MAANYSLVDLQKMKLEKLMQNIDKEVEIPGVVKDRQFPEPPDFIRNIMGSSAGAGSGEFHVYRHLRRKEFARQRFIEEQAKKEEMDAKYKQKLEENMKMSEQKTAKKRLKRLKQKERKKIKKKFKSDKQTAMKTEEESESECEELNKPQNDDNEIINNDEKLTT